MDSMMNTCIGDALDDAAQRWGEAVGWVFEDHAVSFAQMATSTDAVAKSLLALGVGPGDVVALWMPNLYAFALCEFACAKVGAIATPINTRFKKMELQHILEFSDAKVLITVDRFLKHDFIASLAELDIDVAADAGKVSVAAFPRLQRVVTLSADASVPGMSWSQFLDLGRAIEDARLKRVQAARTVDEAVILQFTSGTTALPKGALCNHRYVLHCAHEMYVRMGVRQGEAILNTQPVYHMGGSCAAIPLPLTLGAKMIIPACYDAERVLQLMERESCVARTGYGAMYIMEMNHPNFNRYDLSALRAGWCVGPPSLMEKVRATMGIPGLIQIYGSTEVGITTGQVDEPWEVRSTTCGRPVSGMEIRIVDPASNLPVDAGEQGEIVMRGWQQMSGYFKDPEATRKTIDAQGWVHTGDRGFLDKDGYLHFVSRLKDMLKVGGENVSAGEVEAYLLTHEDIVQVAIIGAPDDRLQEVVMAIIELRDGAQCTEAQIQAFCTGKMANFRVPKHVRFTRTWPLTDSGKIQKHKLRELYLTPGV